MTKKERELVNRALRDAVRLAEEEDDRISYTAQDIVVTLDHALAIDGKGKQDG